MKKILKVNLVCPYCGSSDLWYDYENRELIGKNAKVTFLSESVYAFCLNCGIESERFDQRKLGPLQAHVYACNFVTHDELPQYEIDEEIMKR